VTVFASFRCPNLAVQEAEDDEPEDEDEYEQRAEQGASLSQPAQPKAYNGEKRRVSWVDSPIKEDGRRTFYRFEYFPTPFPALVRVA